MKRTSPASLALHAGAIALGWTMLVGSPALPLPDPATASAALRATEVRGSADRLVLAVGDQVRLRWTGAAGESEERTVEIPEATRLEDVFPVRDEVLIGGVRSSGDGADELVLALAGPAGTRALAAPPNRVAGHSRENPVVIPAANGELAALAWLEGASRRSNAVRVSVWDGNSFAAPQEIAPEGPGSQAALAGATLDDGSALLVWARYDGADDEIVWSRRAAGSNGRWSEVANVAPGNAVPDLVPAITAVPGGALAAWARYDGRTYRVVLARFREGRWEAPVAIGERSTLFPSLERTAEGARLLFANAGERAGWTVLELDAAGRELRRATIAAPDRDTARRRPVATADRLLFGDRELALAFRDTPAKP